LRRRLQRLDPHQALGHALYMKAIHGGKAKNDKIDSHKIAVLVRRNHAQEGRGLRAQVLVDHDGARGVEDAHVHRAACKSIPQ
jgi:hypothetical protein